MKTSEMAQEMRKTLNKLVELFLNRNAQYAGEEEWAANFRRNAQLNKILRMERIINDPYGKSLAFVADKLDRVINGVILTKQGDKGQTHIGDSIDDAIVYLFISKMLLKEDGIVQ